MRLVQIEEMEEFKLIGSLPKTPKFVDYIGLKKIGNSILSMKIIIVYAFIGIVYGAILQIFSVAVGEAFDLSHIESVSVMALSVIMLMMMVLYVVKNMINGMSQSITNNINSAIFGMYGSIALILAFTFIPYIADSKIIATLSYLGCAWVYLAIFFETGVSKSKLKSEQSKELVEIRKFNLQLEKKRKILSRSDVELATAEQERAIEYIHSKTYKIEQELVKYLSE